MQKRLTALLSLFLAALMILMSYPLVAMAQDAEIATVDPLSVIPEDNSKPLYIVCEDESQREANSKVFIMSDGSYSVAVYPFAIHYEYAGEMKEIDNTFVSSDGETM